MHNGELLEFLAPRATKPTTQAICVDVAIEPQAGHIVLISKDNKIWSLPGCQLTAGESPRDGANRVSREETGLVISLHERLSKYSFVDTIGSCVGTSTLFAAKGYGVLTPIDASRFVKEFSLDALPKMICEHAEMVADYMRWISKGIRPELQKRLVSTRSIPSLERHAA